MDNNSHNPATGKREGFVDRRKRNDPVSKSIRVFAVAGWFLLLAVILIVNKASPVTEDFFTRVFGDGPVISYWNMALVNIGFATVLVMFCASIAGLIANTIRHRRKSDRYRISIIAIGIISFILILIFIFSFYV